MPPTFNQLTELDPPTIAAAARRYQRARSFRRNGCRVGIGAILLCAAVLLIDGQKHPKIDGIFFLLAFVTFVSCGVWIIVGCLMVNGFLCPRCGNQVAPKGAPVKDFCCACGLDLGVRSERAAVRNLIAQPGRAGIDSRIARCAVRSPPSHVGLICSTKSLGAL